MLISNILESTYFSFKEGLGSFDPLCRDIDFREASKDTEATVLWQLSCCCLPENQQELKTTGKAEEHGCKKEGISHHLTNLNLVSSFHLSEAEFVVQVLVHLLDHILQANVCLWSTKLLHHQLQLHEVNVVVFPRIIPCQNQIWKMLCYSLATDLKEDSHPINKYWATSEPCSWSILTGLIDVCVVPVSQFPPQYLYSETRLKQHCLPHSFKKSLFISNCLLCSCSVELPIEMGSISSSLIKK